MLKNLNDPSPSNFSTVRSRLSSKNRQPTRMTPVPRGTIPEETILLMEEQLTKLDFLMKKIDREIGYNFWKKYVASAFWSQISTPINLVITFLTAVTTAQAQSPDLLPQSIISQLAIVSLIITTLNTFFRPHTQFAMNTEFLQKWNDVGVRFEKEYYDKVIVRLFTEEEFKNIKEKIKNYEKIQDDMNVIRKSEGTNTVNFLTDLIFIFCYSTCIRNYKRWLDHDHKIAKDQDDQTKRKREREANDMIQKERMKSFVRVELAEIHLHEQELMKRLGAQDESHIVPYPRQNILLRSAPTEKQLTNASIFDMFDSESNTVLSPPSSPPPPPPPPQPQEPPPSITISETNL